MKLLLDTHIAFWLATDRAKLNQRERALIGQPGNELFVATVSVWELRIKWHKLHRSGVRKGPIDPSAALIAFRTMQLPIIPLVPEVAAASLLEPISHKDPFDALLLVHAQELEMRLLTRDGRLTDHPLALIA